MKKAVRIATELLVGFEENVFTPLYDATRGESPRAKIILYAAQIDEYLEILLKKTLIKYRSKKEKEDELFRTYGPLSTFSARIAMAYRLGLISRDDADAFDVLRGLRNDCAHNIYEFSVNSSRARDYIARFVNLSCKDPSRSFMLYVGIPSVPCPKTNEEALNYCCIFHLAYLKQTIESATEFRCRFTNDIFNICIDYPELTPELKIEWPPINE